MSSHVSVSNNQEVDVYLAENGSVHEERTKSKDPMVLVVTGCIVELKSQCWRKRFSFRQFLGRSREGLCANV